jgi:hypothetical protein
VAIQAYFTVHIFSQKLPEKPGLAAGCDPGQTRHPDPALLQKWLWEPILWFCVLMPDLPVFLAKKNVDKVQGSNYIQQYLVCL